jgi:phospholipid/cholesterol/gamma-HCH transport system substrate-binding protein
VTANNRARRTLRALLLTITVGAVAGCQWQGLNSLPLPGTQGHGPGSFTIEAELPDVDNIQQNSRVRVGDVTVGNVAKIERQGWHALLTMTINGDVDLPANATAKIGQTSLLGSLHVELAPPKDVPPAGKLREGSLIPLSSGRAYPSTEKTLAAISLLLNAGGIGQIQDITQSLSTAFAGRANDLRSLIQQIDIFANKTNAQVGDIIAATDSVNGLLGQLADQKPVIDKAVKTIPDALAVLKDQRNNLVELLIKFGQLGALAADTSERSKKSLVKELQDLGPVLKSLADAGPALTRSLSFFTTFPFPKENLSKWMRGDYGNETAIIDLTLSRLDAGLFTGSRWEGNLTELELQWGRTIGQLPSPYTAENPLVVPYRWDQGP